MGDAEGVQVGDEVDRVLKTKTCVKLESIGRDWAALLLPGSQAIETLRNAAGFCKKGGAGA